MGMGPEHRRLLDYYVRDLREVAKIAQTEYSGQLEGEIADGADEETALDSVRRRQGPPAAHPRVLAVIRKYFFECQKLNERQEESGSDDYVYPHVFVHEMLSGKFQDLWDFVAELDYLPIGVDRDQNWI
jgi:hypothetical protein